MQILPKWVEDLVVKDQPDVFDATFRQTFPQQATDMSFSSDTTVRTCKTPSLFY